MRRMRQTVVTGTLTWLVLMMNTPQSMALIARVEITLARSGARVAQG